MDDEPQNPDDKAHEWTEVPKRGRGRKTPKPQSGETPKPQSGETSKPHKHHDGGYHKTNDSYTFTQFSENDIRWFEHCYNTYFETITGKKFNLKMTPESQPYFTSLENRRHLDTLLSSQYHHRPKIWDLMAGIGGDALCMLPYLYPAELDLVDSQAEKGQRCLEHNVGEIQQAFPEVFGPEAAGAPQVRIHHTFYADFIKKYADTHKEKNIKTPTKRAHIDLVYLDPPWGRQKIDDELNQMLNVTDGQHQAHRQAERDDHTAEAESRAEQDGQKRSTLSEIEVDLPIILRYINEIAALLEHYEIDVTTLCFKNRFRMDPDKFDKLTQKHAKILHEKYSVLYSVQCITNEKRKQPEQDDNHEWRRGQFYWVVMRHKKYEEIGDYKHQWVKDEQLHGPQTFWVKRSTYFKPYKPPYSQHMPYPTVIGYTKYNALSAADKRAYEKAPRKKRYTDFLNELEKHRTDALFPSHGTQKQSQLVALLKQLQLGPYK